MRVFCFAEREHAETFQAEIGGEWFDPQPPVELRGIEAALVALRVLSLFPGSLHVPT
jgi:hypothetical protein